MDEQPVDPRLAEIVDKFLEIVRSVPQNTDWQGYYADEGELVDDLRDHADRLRRGDGSRLGELKFFLSATAPICEIAVSSGWSDLYLALANSFDELYSGPATPPADWPTRLKPHF